MEAIEVEEVFQAVMRVLARTVPGTASGAS
jgi:hypothetical protein